MNCYTQKLNTNKNVTDIHEDVDDMPMSLQELKDKEIKQDITIDYEIFQNFKNLGGMAKIPSLASTVNLNP